MNFAENLLRYQDNKIAIVSLSERKLPQNTTYAELFREVARVASALKKEGVGSTDRVVGYMPNIKETIVAMLATASLGATWSSCGAELGPKAALDRLGQIEPKVIFTVDGYTYKDQEFDQLSKVKLLIDEIPSLRKAVIVPFLKENADISVLQKSMYYSDFWDEEATTISFEQVSFSHPLFVMFSSGTTGKPKCMVQGVGGILINHLKELVLHSDLKRKTRIMYLTSPSWMMWNWVTSALGVGSTLVLYEGNPLHPTWRKVWKIIEEQHVNVFGCSASYLHYLKKIGAKPREDFDLSHLTQISQTGSALSDEGFDYVYAEIKEDLHFNSISGGTDINGCFAAGNPLMPVYAGELQARALGMHVEAYDDKGNSTRDQQAELVCLSPSPSMPLYFFNDDGNEKYKNAYFGFFEEEVWRHGDYIMIDSETGGVSFYGRSDSVLKPSGVRIGTAEIYNIVEQMDEIIDSLAIGHEYENDQRIILFVQLANDVDLDDNLKSKIKSLLRSKASPRHAPSLIVSTPDIPYTFSGKKVESAVTNILHHRKVSNADAMRNPTSLEFYGEFIKNLE